MPRRRLIPLFIPHAGCPERCVFCDQRRISGAQTPVTPAQVAQQIRQALPKAGAGCQLAFYGGSFTALALPVQRGLLEAAAPFLQTGELDSIRLSTRPDALDPARCQLLRDYGVTTVELGCQSMDETVLRLAGRGHGPQDTVRAVVLLREYGFSVVAQMMTGLPGDSGRASLLTAERLIALKPDGVRIYPTVVLKDTPLARQMQAGDYRPQTVEEATALCATLYERFLAAGIPVIRVGLNPTQELSQGQVLAGAYHPALGELVLGEMYLRRARALLAAHPGPVAGISVHPRRVSAMAGQRRRNLLALHAEFPQAGLKLRPLETELWGLRLLEP